MPTATDQQGQQLNPAAIYSPPTQRKHGSRIPTLVWILLIVAALLGGAYAGHSLRSPIDFGTLANVTSLTEEQLDEPIGTYVIGDEPHSITAREAILQQSSLDAMRNSDGTYAVPSTESVLAAARTAVIMQEVESRGITVTDDEMLAYAEDTFGTSDLAELGSSFTMDEETMRDRLRESCATAKLRSQVVSEPLPAPEPPAAPEEGKEGDLSPEYATYIINLVGDEWDSSTGDWASTDGPYAQALHDYEVRSDASTYDAANTAYNVAYQLYSANTTSPATQWTDYVNGLLAKAKFAVSTIVS